jgi:hypothetical protein
MVISNDIYDDEVEAKTPEVTHPSIVYPMEYYTKPFALPYCYQSNFFSILIKEPPTKVRFHSS